MAADIVLVADVVLNSETYWTDLCASTLKIPQATADLTLQRPLFRNQPPLRQESRTSLPLRS